MCKTIANQRGFSFVEMIIALGLAVIILTAFVQLYIYSGRATVWGEQRAQSTRESRLAMMRIQRDFRQAGLIAIEDADGDTNDIFRDVVGQTFSDSVNDMFEEATSNSVTFEGDIDNDNLTETVRYYLEGNRLKRYVWEWSRTYRRWIPEIEGRVVGNNVDFLMFTYFDGANNPIPNPVPSPYQGLTLNRQQRAGIKSVGVDLITRSDRQDFQRVHTGVYPDNTTFRDGFVRQHLADLVKCRNL
jgi:prepilin-type N-terminal cleavage/methylation domain-containing protein